jgi:hypothetical protein
VDLDQTWGFEMAGFWQHYAQANDDIRTQLVDRAWFDQRVGSNAMESDVQSMRQSSDLYGQGQEAHDQNLDGPEVAQDGQQEASDPAEALYGDAPDQNDAAQFYGYDALDEEQDQELTQRL